MVSPYLVYPIFTVRKHKKTEMEENNQNNNGTSCKGEEESVRLLVGRNVPKESWRDYHTCLVQ